MVLKVACTTSESRPLYVAALKDDPAVELVLCDDEPATIAAMEHCDALVMGGSQYTRGIADALLSRRHRITWLQLASIGVDNLARFGIPDDIVVCNAPLAVAPAVAEHALALMLAGKRQIVEIDRTRAQALPRSAFVDTLSSLDGATLLVVGYGPIGREIARRARGFDMRIVACTRRPRNVDDAGVELHGLDELDALLPQADVVVLALALARETRHFFGAACFERMKPSAWLVNVARGELVEQPALVEALRAGRIAGAALDVTDVEPLPVDSPLRTMTNVIVTPHVAGFGSEATRRRLADVVVGNVRRRAAGEPLDNVVERSRYASL